LLHYWRAVGEGRRNAWFALSIEIGLMLLTSYSALLLIGLLIAFTVATRRGRAALTSVDPWFSLIVVAALVLPHALWVSRAGIDTVLPALPDTEALKLNIRSWPAIVGALAGMLVGIAALIFLNVARFGPGADEVPTILRPPLSGFARAYILFISL